MAEEIYFNSCRKCANSFEYICSNGHKAYIIAGSPLDRDRYHAISYVWESTRKLPYRCRKCGFYGSFPVRDKAKFDKLAQFSEAEVGLWLDALSIDQDDAHDVRSQLGVMGQIYEGAESVMILLPPSDQYAYFALRDIAELTHYIYEHRGILKDKPASQAIPQGLPSIGTTSTASQPATVLGQGTLTARPGNLEDFGKVCTNFFSLFESFRAQLPTLTYWQRAWTFQEWVLARKLCIALDSNEDTSWIRITKHEVIFVVTYLAVYRRMLGQYAPCKVGFENQQAVLTTMTHIKRLFPDERAFMPIDEMQEEDLEFSFNSPSIEPSSGLGLRSVSNPRHITDTNTFIERSFDLNSPMPAPFSDVKRGMGRLSITLNALGETQRQARHEADLVSCWASMCNIQYDYNKTDSFATALQKVLKVLRDKHKMRIYCFHVNTETADASVDITFLDYARTHEQCNSHGNAQLLGTPIFTGRADAATHLRNSLLPPTVSPVVENTTPYITPVMDSNILVDVVTNLQDTAAVIDFLAASTTGTFDGFSFTNILNTFQDILGKTSPRDLSAHKLVAVFSYDESKTPYRVPEGGSFWALIPSSINLHSLEVARESLNGTLVLTQPTATGHQRILAYFTVTDQLSGTHLVKIDEQGWIRIKFKTTPTPGITNSELMQDRMLVRRLQLKGMPQMSPTDPGRKVPFVVSEERGAGLRRQMARMEASFAKQKLEASRDKASSSKQNEGANQSDANRSNTGPPPPNPSEVNRPATGPSQPNRSDATHTDTNPPEAGVLDAERLEAMKKWLQ